MPSYMTGEPVRWVPTMTASEASAVLNVSLTTVYRWAREGRIRAYRDGAQWRCLHSGVLALAATADDVDRTHRPGLLDRLTSSASDEMPASCWPERL